MAGSPQFDFSPPAFSVQDVFAGIHHIEGARADGGSHRGAQRADRDGLASDGASDYSFSVQSLPLPASEAPTENSPRTPAPPHARKCLQVAPELEDFREEFTVQVCRRQGASRHKLGLLTVAVSSDALVGLQVRVIKPGLIARWNVLHPEREVRVHDIVVKVNGKEGDADTLRAAIALDDDLDLTLRRTEADADAEA
uniref:PDZ domain-containing protein n=1 Tax=Zooxanthella nutricula TaxID=1333877 RepID=A0A7S2JU90_9DINO